MKWDQLLALEPVRDLVADYWDDSEGQEWTDDEISQHLSLISPDARDVTWKYFPLVKAFFNQQLMFEAVGYESQAAFDAVDGESIAFCEFLDGMALLDWDSILSRHPIVKVRSVNGEYSNLISMEDMGNKSLEGRYKAHWVASLFSSKREFASSIRYLN